MDKLRVSIGVCAYQEEKNIARLLEALRSQRTQRIEISQIIVVSSACQDLPETPGHLPLSASRGARPSGGNGPPGGCAPFLSRF